MTLSVSVGIISSRGKFSPMTSERGSVSRSALAAKQTLGLRKDAWPSEAAAGRRPAVRRGSVSGSAWVGPFARNQANSFCARAAAGHRPAVRSGCGCATRGKRTFILKPFAAFLVVPGERQSWIPTKSVNIAANCWGRKRCRACDPNAS